MTLLETVSLVGFAFSAGALTFFAPCAYPLLPGYVSYYLGEDAGDSPGATSRTTAADGGGQTSALQPDPSRIPLVSSSPLARAIVVGTLVSVGFFVVYGVLAGIVVAFGARLLAQISLLELVVGVVLIAIGVPMALGVHIPTPTIPLPERRRSLGSYVGFGVLYAAAAAGCTAPIFIGVALKGISTGPTAGVLTLAAYAAGMSVLMILVTVGTALGRGALLTVFTERMDTIHRVAGVMLVGAGLVQLYFFLFRFGWIQMVTP